MLIGNFRMLEMYIYEWCVLKQTNMLRHQRGMVSTLLATYEGNPPVTGGFPSKWANNAGFDNFFDDNLDS